MTRQPTGKQHLKVLQALQNADGGWVSKEYLIRTLGLTQAGARIFELENDYGINIEHSPFTDPHGFKSYRLASEEPATLSLLT